MIDRLFRLILGLIFVVFGLNGFLSFIPVPDYHPFMEVMVNSGFIYAVKAIEIGAGILLVANQWPRLAQVLLAPVVVNITLYHLLLDPRNWLITPVLVLLLGYLFWRDRKWLKTLLDRPCSNG